MRMAVNEIIPNRLYQRGQILTWKYQEKMDLLNRYNIGVVVNFWHKIDPDMSDVIYFHMPSRSEDMLKYPVWNLLTSVQRLLYHDDNMAALILCEAGVTRSVFFSTLLMAELLDISKAEALYKISKILPNNKMKPYMRNYLLK